MLQGGGGSHRSELEGRQRPTGHRESSGVMTNDSHHDCLPFTQCLRNGRQFIDKAGMLHTCIWLSSAFRLGSPCLHAVGSGNVAHHRARKLLQCCSPMFVRQAVTCPMVKNNALPRSPVRRSLRAPAPRAPGTGTNGFYPQPNDAGKDPRWEAAFKLITSKGPRCSAGVKFAVPLLATHAYL